MDYAAARGQVKTGDLIAVRDVHNILGTMTRFFTRSPYTHTGVAIWLGERLFMADLNSGRNALHAMSQLKNFDVFEAPPGVAPERIEGAIFDWLASPISYGFLAFLVIGLKCFLGIKSFIHWRQIIVCSGGSVEIYEMAGWPEHSRMISPGELTTMVGPLRLQVRK
jgi:hypothetical protein